MSGSCSVEQGKKAEKLAESPGTEAPITLPNGEEEDDAPMPEKAE